MTLIAVLLSAVLIAVAALHLLWAVGYWFPVRDEAQLALTVVGARGIEHMPGAVPCAVVAMACLFLAILPHHAGFPFRIPLLALAAAVFLLRGFATYLPAWRRLVPEQPFATLDTRFFGPLCLFLGAGFLILTFGAF